MTAFNGLAYRLLNGWAVQKQAAQMPSGAELLATPATVKPAPTSGITATPGVVRGQSPLLSKTVTGADFGNKGKKSPELSNPSAGNLMRTPPNPAAGVTSPAVTGGQSPQYMG